MDITDQEDEEEISEAPAPKKSPVCIICGNKAEFCVRGVPKDSYCRECAEECFGIDALDRI